MSTVPECFYRISIKALILNETRDKFLICEEDDGVWELPGGGLDWGATPQEDLPREIKEEMGLETTSVAEDPSYFLTMQTLGHKIWIANVLYETSVEHLDIIPSDECVSVKFVNKDDLAGMNVYPNVTQLAEMFDPKKHTQK